MKKVMFWTIGDVIVSCAEPSKTWIVTATWEKSNRDRWVKIEDPLLSKQSIEGREEFIQSLGFVGYRDSTNSD